MRLSRRGLKQTEIQIAIQDYKLSRETFSPKRPFHRLISSNGVQLAPISGGDHSGTFPVSTITDAVGLIHREIPG